MTHTSPPRRRRRGAVFVALGLVLATAASAFGASPAAAATAPLVTDDGLGIRIDENAIVGPALQAIEDALQPWVNDRIYQGAWENSVMDNPDWVQGSADLDLSFDFINAGVSGYPQGGLKVHADLKNIMMRFYRYGAWWQPECQFRVNPDNGWIDASAKIDTTKLPNAPLTVNPISAYWDNSPTITREKGNFLCTGYLLDEWWDGLWGNSTDVAAQLEDELNDVAQDLIDDLWADYVTPAVDSLEAFGLSFGQVRTDDHGLIVTADVDATNGLTIPGDPSGLSRNVATTEDSGATSDVNTLLAARSEVTVTIHPNVANQFLNAVNQVMNSNISAPQVPGAAVEEFLLPPASRGAFADNGWSVAVSVTQPYYTQPTGTGGRPQVRMPQTKLTFYNSSYVFGFLPVAVFTTNVTGLDLLTEIRPGTDDFGPYISSAGAAVSGGALVTGSSHPDVVGWSPDPAGLVPYVQSSVDLFSDAFLADFVTLAPIELGGIPVTLCTSCSRVSGDQRYTEFFNVG